MGVLLYAVFIGSVNLKCLFLKHAKKIEPKAFYLRLDFNKKLSSGTHFPRLSSIAA